MVILVTGATGNVGRNVVAQLLAEGVQVRALTRDPGAARLPAEVEVFAGDLQAPESLPAALDGVERAFLFPVFGALEGFLQAAVAAQLRQVVLLSSSFSAGSLSELNEVGRRHAACEQAVLDSGLPWTFVRPVNFMANDLSWAAQIQAQGVVRGAYGEARTVPIDERDVAAAAVAALLDERHLGQAYTLSGGQALTQAERVGIIGSVLGRELAFEELALDQARVMMGRFLPAPVVEVLLAGLAAQVGARPSALPGVEELTGRPPYGYEQWVRHRLAEFNGTAAGAAARIY